MLFDQPFEFAGLPREGFEKFSIPDREQRRRAIIGTIHPPLNTLGEDLLHQLSGRCVRPFHTHLPRLDWPAGYQPFCTWLALSHHGQGYQAGPQLNLGVHAEFVSIRLGWDTSSVNFSRFEFHCRHGKLREPLLERGQELGLSFAVYGSAPWPEGSKLVFQSPTDIDGSFDEVQRRGVWWELGVRHNLPEALDFLCSPALGKSTGEIFDRLLAVYEQIEADDKS